MSYPNSIPAPNRMVARAIAENLQRRGITKIASVQNLRDAADYAAATVKFASPVNQIDGVYRHSRPHPKVIEKIAECLITIDRALEGQEHGRKIAGVGPAIFGDRVDFLLGDILGPIKMAMEGGLTGNAVVDGDPQQNNTMANSQSVEALMELARKPEGYASVGPGGAVKSLPQEARTGVEFRHPLVPVGVGGAVTNEVEAVALAPAPMSAAPLNNEVTTALAKMAMGSATGANIVSGDPSQNNTLANSQSVEAKQELKVKPLGYANVVAGGAVHKSVPAGAVVGADYAHPLRESGVGGVSANEVSVQKQAYYNNVWNQLPLSMSPEMKLAAVENFRNSNVSDHARYMHDLHTRQH